MEENKIIDGKAISSAIKEEVRLETIELKKQKGITPGLAFIIVGDNPASQIYVRNKGKACEEMGFYSVTKALPQNTTKEEILSLIDSFNKDEKIHGILVQMPLPGHLNETEIIQAIDYKKDVDGFHPVNIGRLSLDKDCFVPCTPAGIIELLRRSNIPTEGKTAVVIGRSNIVGKPVANLLLKKSVNSTVIVCHSATKNIKDFTTQADIIIVAMGKAGFLKGEMIKPGCTIIDVGINRVPDDTKKSGYRTTGDVDFESCIKKCSHITPVPGGVGPMTIAMLMKNTLISAKGDLKF